MASRFQRTRRGIVGRLDPDEREVLASLLHDVGEMLAPEPPPGAGGASPPPDAGAGPAATGASLPGAGGALSAAELEAMLGITEDAAVPEDPALARLLPDASRDDPSVSAEFRRYTEAGLRARKRSAIDVVLAGLAAADAASARARAAGGEPPARAPAASLVGALTGSRPPHPDDVVLDDAAATAWMTALNDVRLVVAERLGVRTDADAARVAARAARPQRPATTGAEATAAWLASIYDFLTWLQETLVVAVAAGGYR